MRTDDSSYPASRRHAISVLGTTLATAPIWLATAGSASAQTDPAAPVPAAAPTPTPPPTAQRRAMQDPRNEYPKPPFPQQDEIKWPGLTSGMTPRPDHGETSYVGSGRLAGRRALITGGDSGLGRAAAIAYAREGADVAIGYLPAEQSDADEVVRLIRAEGRTAVTVPGDIRDEAFCRQMVADVKQGIRVNAVAPGPYWTPLQPSGGQPIEDVRTFGADTPIGRPGQPAEIAPIFVLLASQESSFATGNVYSSTGGSPGP